MKLILPTVPCGSETWSLILREENVLMTFGDKRLKKTSEPMKNNATGGWRKMLNYQILNVHSSGSKIRILMSSKSRNGEKKSM
jgi:hypothetical protein